VTLAERVRGGEIGALARAATLIENRKPEAAALLRELWPHTGRALAVGITGPPGAGKSTLVSELTAQWRARGKRVAVIAVDPSSPFSGGAVLGDRIRMMRHAEDGGVFMRSMATRGRLGGLAPATFDLALLCDAAAFDVVMVETVGVGQAEVDIARLAGVTVVVLVPGMGDGIQASKAGILEVADLFCINKNDRPGADDLARELHAEAPEVPLLRTTASEGLGVGELLEAVEAWTPRQDRAARQWTGRLRELLMERLATRIPDVALEKAAERVARREADPYSVVEEFDRKIRMETGG